MTAAKAALAEYLDSAQLDSRQIYFVNQIVEYIVHNGMMKDLSAGNSHVQNMQNIVNMYKIGWRKASIGTKKQINFTIKGGQT